MRVNQDKKMLLNPMNFFEFANSKSIKAHSLENAHTALLHARSMQFPPRAATTSETSGVWIMVCPVRRSPYLMRVPAATAFDSAAKHLAILAPGCSRGSRHAWGIDSDFTFHFDMGDAKGEHILFGLCNEDGPYANLERNGCVSDMLHFYTEERGTFGPFAFVLARVQPPVAPTQAHDSKDSDAEMQDEDLDDEEVPVDIDSVWPLQRMLDHWETALREQRQKRHDQVSSMRDNVTVCYF